MSALTQDTIIQSVPQCLTIDAGALEAVMLACDTGSFRYTMNSVCFELYADDTIGMIATDGKRLHSFNAPRINTPVKSMMIASSELEKVLSAWKIIKKNVGKKQFKALSLTFEDMQPTQEKVKFSILQGIIVEMTVELPIVQGVFPQWRSIIPVPSWTKSDSFAAIDMALLADFGRIAKLLGNDKERVNIHFGETAQEPMTITIPDKEFVGVLMPMSR